MKTTSIVSTALVLALLGSLGACGKRDEEMGPAQKAGAAIDNAGDKVAEQLQENLKKADQAAKDIADKAKATGDKISDATEEAAEDASKGLSQATENVGKKVEKAGEKIQEAARPK